MDEELLNRYAELIVGLGASAQPDQVVAVEGAPPGALDGLDPERTGRHRPPTVPEVFKVVDEGRAIEIDPDENAEALRPPLRDRRGRSPARRGGPSGVTHGGGEVSLLVGGVRQI